VSRPPTRQRNQAPPLAGPGQAAAPPGAGMPASHGTRAWPAAAAYAPPVVAAATMLLLGFWGLARQSAMGNDEVASRWAAMLSLPELRHLLGNLDAVHGLYYLLLHGWVAVGTSPAVIRIPSVIAMAAAVAMTAIVGRRLTGSGWAGLFAGLIMALTPAISYFAQTARSYALVTACVMAATLAFLRAMDAEAAGSSRSRLARRWAFYGLLIALGGYLNELSLVVLGAHAATLLLARGRRQTAVRWAIAAVAAVLLVSPLLVVSIRQAGAVGWIPPPTPGDLWLLFRDDFGATPGVAFFLLGCAVVAVLPPLRTRHRPGQAAADAASEPARAWWASGGVSLPSVAVPLLVLPPAILIAESLIGHPLYVGRYVLYTEAGAALLAGAGIYRIGRWLAGRSGHGSALWVPGVIICASTLVFQLGPQRNDRTPQVRLFDLGGPAAYVGAHARPGDGVLFFDSFYRKVRLGYPGDFRGVSDFAMAKSPVQVGNFDGTDQPFPVIRTRMLAHQRIWVVGRRPSAKVISSSIRQQSRLLHQRFTLIARKHFSGVWVTLWRQR
jgi:mannosyltransferase